MIRLQELEVGQDTRTYKREGWNSYLYADFSRQIFTTKKIDTYIHDEGLHVLKGWFVLYTLKGTVLKRRSLALLSERQFGYDILQYQAWQNGVCVCLVVIYIIKHIVCLSVMVSASTLAIFMDRFWKKGYLWTPHDPGMTRKIWIYQI